MAGIELGLIFAAFFAGILMFLAPCTLPLVPAFLAFVSGVKTGDKHALSKHERRLIIKNSLFYVLGFSTIFILFGILFGFLGVFIAEFRTLLSQIGGFLIILFGLFMLGMFNIKFLSADRKVSLPAALTPGNPISAFLMGSTFALGWTPCVGPVLASVLLLASTPGSVWSGGVLLGVFSLGLAIPFMLVAVFYVRAQKIIQSYSWISKSINYIGGVFLILIGLLLVTDNFVLTVEYGYKVFDWLGLSALFSYL